MKQLIMKGKFFIVNLHICLSDTSEDDDAKGNAEEELKHILDDFNKYQMKVLLRKLQC
jgi:hypothetical protein